MIYCCQKLISRRYKCVNYNSTSTWILQFKTALNSIQWYKSVLSTTSYLKQNWIYNIEAINIESVSDIVLNQFMVKAVVKYGQIVRQFEIDKNVLLLVNIHCYLISVQQITH